MSMSSRVVASPPLPGNVVLDVDGCLTIDGAAVPGAPEAIRSIQGHGVRCLIATNNSTRTAADVAQRLNELLGVELDPGLVVTSSMAVVSLLDPTHDPALVIGEEGLRATLANAGIATTEDPDRAQSVIVGLDRHVDYDALRRATSAVASGAAFFATNDDATFPSSGPDMPGAGSILAAIERASGKKALVAGKPYAPMVGCVSTLLALGATWVVGDRPETDVAFARAGNWCAILVLTGIATDGAAAIPSPDLILPSVADLPELLAR